MKIGILTPMTTGVYKDDTTVYVDCNADSGADLFEILVNPVLDGNGNPSAVNTGNIRACTHMTNPNFWNGNVDSSAYYHPRDVNGSTTVNGIPIEYATTTGQDEAVVTINKPGSPYHGQIARKWMYYYPYSIILGENYNPLFIGLNNILPPYTSIPQGVDEFRADLSLSDDSFPMSDISNTGNYTATSTDLKIGQQRIWTKGLNVGDSVWIRIIGGTKLTGYGVRAGSINVSDGDIEVINTQNYFENYEILVNFNSNTMLDASIGDQVITVEDTKYYNLREGNTYNIGGSNIKIDKVYSSMYTTDRTSLSTISQPVDLSYWAKYNDVFTVAYNEALQAFTGFYSFIPEWYINFDKGFFTKPYKNNAANNGLLYRHNKGEMCSFYSDYYDTYVDIIVNNHSSLVKEFNNFEYYSETILNGQTIDNVTAYSIMVENDYQQSEEVILYPLSNDEDLVYLNNLYPGTDAALGRYILYNEGDNKLTTSSENAYHLANVRRTIDHWRTAVPRAIITRNTLNSGDYSGDYSTDYNLFVGDAEGIYNDYDRIRSPYCKVRIRFKNDILYIKDTPVTSRTKLPDRRIILHKFNTQYQQIIV